MMEGPLNSILFFGTHQQTHVALNNENIRISWSNTCHFENALDHLDFCLNANRVKRVKSIGVGVI